MSEQADDQELTIDCEWWWVAAYINGMFGIVPAEEALGGKYKVFADLWPIANGVSIRVFANKTDYNFTEKDLALRFEIRGNEATTQITISTSSAHPDLFHYWVNVYYKLSYFVDNARTLRRRSIGPTVDAVIEEYNRRKAAGSSTTLRQLANDAGMSYSYVRKRKSLKGAKQGGNKEGNTGNKEGNT